MQIKSISLAALLLASLPAMAFAQAAIPANVDFTASATMPSLKDPSRKDVFAVTIDDAQVRTEMDLTCSAGYTQFLVVRSDKACAVSGSGAIVNPSNQALLPRTQYSGGYTVNADGFTDGSGMSINYLALGKVAPSTGAFSGSMHLKPEVTSTGAAALTATVLDSIGQGSGGDVIDQRVDTVDLNRLFIPSAGLPSDAGCTWSGNIVFAYQTASWFLDLKAVCGKVEYALRGNMPLTETPGVEAQTQYDLTLTLPSSKSNSNDALFASSDANSDLFAAADGVSAQIIMANSKLVTIDVDGVPTETPSQVDASGQFVGTNVPVEVVRSLATLFGLLSSNLCSAPDNGIDHSGLRDTLGLAAVRILILVGSTTATPRTCCS